MIDMQEELFPVENPLVLVRDLSKFLVVVRNPHRVAGSTAFATSHPSNLLKRLSVKRLS